MYKYAEDGNGLAICYNKFAENKIALGENEIAKSYLDSTLIFIDSNSLADKEIFGKYYYLKGYLEHRERNFKTSSQSLKKAFENYESAIKVDEFDLALVSEWQGANNYHLWNLGKAEKHLQKALKIYLKKGQGNEERISTCYSYLSRVYTRSEQHSKALLYNKKTLTLNRQIYGENHPQVGLAYAIMAITYGRMVDFEKSLTYYKKANAIFIPNLGEGHRWVVTTYENIGRVYNRLGKNQKSLINYEKAISLGKKHLGEDDLIVAHVYLNAADTYASIGNNPKALELYQKALEVQKKTYGEKHREVAQNYIAQGNFYKHIKDYTSALEKFNLVLDTYNVEISRAIDSDLILEEMNVLYKIVEALEGKAVTLKYLYKQKGDIANVTASKETFEQAQTIIEKMRLATTAYEDKVYLTSSNQVSLRGIVETNFLLNEAQGELTSLQEAFFYSERNRARVLQQMSQQNATASDDPQLKELLEKEITIKENKSAYLSKIENEKNNKPRFDTLKIAEYENELFKINLQHDSLIVQMQKKYPNYTNIEFGKGPDKLSEIQSRLNSNTTLLEYFVTDSSTTYAFLISKKKFDARKLKTPALVQKVAKLKQAILEKNIPMFKKSANILYKDLIGPIAKEIEGNELVIIPDGPTWHINFELLLPDNEVSNNPKDFEYLLRNYVISYANSASLLLNKKGKGKEYEDGMLAFSFSDTVRSGSKVSLATLRNQTIDLPGTRKEIREIAELIDGDYYYGNHAQEANFKRIAKNYKIIHLALHAEADNENPKNSRLYFTKGKDTIQDNILYGHELLNLDITSDLVVLSACNTGTGKVTAGEGIMSIGNAFQYAGTKSLLISGWEVSDKTTPELMKLFYTNLRAGMNKPKALQLAKLTYLENAEAAQANPFYWGSFYLVGDTSSIDLESSKKWSYILVGLIAVLVGIFFWYRNSKIRYNNVA
ncbi:CHAT domain-containing protein [Spongiimicrobium sp. 3-5]|uniref:CHAT domain-containing protein n=1 Tax=Spongiimicrobium sp. 3-5 TaxID=3332596 RepID=UPI0039816D73